MMGSIPSGIIIRRHVYVAVRQLGEWSPSRKGHTTLTPNLGKLDGAWL